MGVSWELVLAWVVQQRPKGTFGVGAPLWWLCQRTTEVVGLVLYPTPSTKAVKEVTPVVVLSLGHSIRWRLLTIVAILVDIVVSLQGALWFFFEADGYELWSIFDVCIYSRDVMQYVLTYHCGIVVTKVPCWGHNAYSPCFCLDRGTE